MASRLFIHGLSWPFLASCLCAVACSQAAPTGASPPLVKNLILITCDTLRSDHIGVYGEKRPLTPHLDAFARSSVLFEQAYSSAPMTQPSVSCLLTGKLPGEIGVTPGSKRRMPAAAETLAERLQAAGFATAAVVSNYVLRSDPEREERIGVCQGFDHFDDHMTSREVNRELRERFAKDTTDSALAWLESPKQDADQRFFLWVHYQDPHGPYTPPEEYLNQFPPEPKGESLLKVGETNRGEGQLPSYQILLDSKDPAMYRARYAGEVRYFDEELGRLLAYLEQHKLFENSLVVFTTDHGESHGEHGYWFCHGETVHHELVHVPLILRFPGAPVGIRIAAPASHLDFWPTALTALGLPCNDARGLVLLEPERLPADRYLAQFLRPEGKRPNWSAISDGQFRLVWGEKQGKPGLYDMRADPGELNDLSAKFPERVAKLRQAFNQLSSSLVDIPSVGTRDGVSEEERARLKALGYAEAEDDDG